MSTVLGNYLIEVDGVTVCQAQEVETGGAQHKHNTTYVGNRANPVISRGKYEIDEVTIKQAHALNAEGLEFVRLFQNYLHGLDMTKRTIRIVTLGEDGFTAVAIDEYIDCVPTKFVPEGKKAASNDTAHFSITFKPTDHIPSY
jgi:hypothetical protein